MDILGTYASEGLWIVLGAPPDEDLPCLYLDGERIFPVEILPFDVEDVASDKTKSETDEP